MKISVLLIGFQIGLLALNNAASAATACRESVSVRSGGGYNQMDFSISGRNGILKGATVFLMGTSGFYSCLTDSLGKCKLTLPRGFSGNYPVNVIPKVGKVRTFFVTIDDYQLATIKICE